MFFKARGIFTSAQNWSLSGQNDSKKFVNNLPTLPRSTEISVEGKRAALVLFVSIPCGTPKEDTDILNFTKKNFPLGVGYDDLNLSESCNDQDDEPRQKKWSRGATEGAQSDMMQQFGDAAMKTVHQFYTPCAPVTWKPPSQSYLKQLRS
jgi:hypothetical protein